MHTITIPKGLSQLEEEFVAIPKGIYNEFLNWQKKIKSLNTFKPTQEEKEKLIEARQDFSNGEHITLKNLKHELGIDNS